VTGRDVNEVVTKHRACLAVLLEWADGRGLTFDAANTEAALIICGQGHKMHLRPKLRAKMRVGNDWIRFTIVATRWLGVWMDAYLMVKEHLKRSMNKTRAAQAIL
jgi:hypothetical protein